jgi:hypothetical protein
LIPNFRHKKSSGFYLTWELNRLAETYVMNAVSSLDDCWFLKRKGEIMSRRYWLWLGLAGIPFVAAGALIASQVRSTSSSTQPTPQVESANVGASCSTSECCKECPPDCPPEACPYCDQ